MDKKNTVLEKLVSNNLAANPLVKSLKPSYLNMSSIVYLDSACFRTTITSRTLVKLAAITPLMTEALTTYCFSFS